MAARIPLERGDWAAAAAFPAPDPAVHGVGPPRSAASPARSARPGAAGLRPPGPRWRRSTRSRRDLAARKEPYWARVAGIKRDAAAAWVLFATGDTRRRARPARAAADTEEVTDKHPVTPAELLPARELQADMLLAAGRYAEARAAYRATLVARAGPGPEPVRRRAGGRAGRRPRGGEGRVPRVPEADEQGRWRAPRAGDRQDAYSLTSHLDFGGTTMPAIAKNTKATVIPCLRYRNAPAAIEWLCRVSASRSSSSSRRGWHDRPCPAQLRQRHDHGGVGEGFRVRQAHEAARRDRRRRDAVRLRDRLRRRRRLRAGQGRRGRSCSTSRTKTTAAAASPAATSRAISGTSAPTTRGRPRPAAPCRPTCHGSCDICVAARVPGMAEEESSARRRSSLSGVTRSARRTGA